MVIGYVEKRYIDLRFINREFKEYGVDDFISSSFKFEKGFEEYNIFVVEQLADELIPLFRDWVLEIVFSGNREHLKSNVMWLLVNQCCVSFIDVVSA